MRNSTSLKPLPKQAAMTQQFNILDRLAKKLLQWDFSGDWAGRAGPVYAKLLPDAFTSSQQYIENWEPLVIREIQKSVLSEAKSNWKASIFPGEFVLYADPHSSTGHTCKVEARCLPQSRPGTEMYVVYPPLTLNASLS